MTRLTSRALCERAAANTLMVNALLDAKFASIKAPPSNRKPTSLKSAIDIAFQDGSNVTEQVMKLRKSASAIFGASQDDLRAATDRLLNLIQLSKYLDGEGEYPEHLSEEYRAPAFAVKAARQAGIDAGPTLSAEIRQAVILGKQQIEHLEKTVLPRRVAAWKVGHFKNSQRLFNSLAKLHPEKPYAMAAKRAGISLKRAEAEYDGVRKAGAARGAQL